LVHLYIAFKAGLIARWVKKQFGIPYAVSEQWTLYLPEAKPGFSELPLYTRLLFKRIFKGSESVMVVSNYLAQQITRLFGVTNLIVIPNVVDQAMFRYSEKAEAVQNRFVHISTLTFQKNPEGMLQAFSLVKQQGYAFKLDIIGPSCPPLEQAAIELDLQDYVEFHKEMPQRELVSFVQNADALVLFSRYETFGCVLIEANACGVPVIVSDHPVLQENVRSGENGLFARNEDPADLAAQIIHIICNGHTFNKAKIAQTAAEQFSYRRVGAQLNAWYSKHKKADVCSDKLQDDHEKF
jgi:glycosyltransferase involved in cell wall biosynthesis